MPELPFEEADWDNEPRADDKRACFWTRCDAPPVDTLRIIAVKRHVEIDVELCGEHLAVAESGQPLRVVVETGPAAQVWVDYAD